MLRVPTQTAKSLNITATTSGNSVNTLPNNDLHALVGKLTITTLSGTSPTLDVYIQTTDDGGTTYYDVAHFAQQTGAVTNANALWVTIPVDMGDGKYVGAAADASINASTVNGLPLLSSTYRVKYVYGGTVGTANWTLTLYQSTEEPK